MILYFTQTLWCSHHKTIYPITVGVCGIISSCVWFSPDWFYSWHDWSVPMNRCRLWEGRLDKYASSTASICLLSQAFSRHRPYHLSFVLNLGNMALCYVSSANTKGNEKVWITADELLWFVPHKKYILYMIWSTTLIKTVFIGVFWACEWYVPCIQFWRLDWFSQRQILRNTLATPMVYLLVKFVIQLCHCLSCKSAKCDSKGLTTDGI